MQYMHMLLTESDLNGNAEALLKAVSVTGENMTPYEAFLQKLEKSHELNTFHHLYLYPRNPPSHKIWPADYFGQEHWVTTKETHFVSVPRDDELGGIEKVGSQRVLRDEEPRLLQNYRSPEPVLNMTLKVLSWWV